MNEIKTSIFLVFTNDSPHFYIGMRHAALSSSPDRLAFVLKELIGARGLKQKALAKQVGLTESSLSMILNAKARPRQLTLTRLLQRLDCNPEEQQQVLSAYDQSEATDIPLRPGIRDVPTPQDELDRVERYLAVKCESVQFERAVEAAIRKRGLSFEHPHIQDRWICDFFIPGPPRTVVECKVNTRRDWDRTITTVKILGEKIPCDRVFVVVPAEDELVSGARDEIETESVRLVALSNLEEVL